MFQRIPEADTSFGTIHETTFAEESVMEFIAYIKLNYGVTLEPGEVTIEQVNNGFIHRSPRLRWAGEQSSGDRLIDTFAGLNTHRI